MKVEWKNKEGQNFRVIVDFAHEPLSYRELFVSLKNMLDGDGRLISIIGSDGGGRDISKRGEMGKIAGELSDIVLVTDVNCYDEDPKEIAEMLAIGSRKADKKDNKDLFIEIDREKAIKLAIKMAKKGDIVVITGKGTEPCIVQANGKELLWDDREVTRKILKMI